MADIDDVLASLAVLAAQQLYPPNGTATQGQVSSVVNAVCKIYPGWPAADQLDKDLKATSPSPIVNVSVFALPGMENLTRYPQDWQADTKAPAPTITATVDSTGTQVTIGGTVSVPQNVALIVNGFAYVYSVQPGDTLASIAAALAALLVNMQYLGTQSGQALGTQDGSIIGLQNGPTVVGNVITIPGAYRTVARVGTTATNIREVGRVRQRFQITTWAPTPALRAAVSRLIKTAIMATNFLTMPDNFAARLLLTGDAYTDKWEKQLAYRRDLMCSVEYATTQTETETEIIVVQAQFTGGQDGVEPIGTFNY